GRDAGGAARRRVHGVADDARSVCLVDETAVAGTRHVPGVRALADGLAPGDELAFVRDRCNPYDPWATEVRDGRGNRLGYVSCEHNEVVARLLDGGRDVAGLVGSVDQLGNWTRIQMEVRLYA
ncbi:HIRAN domain-containing protein, partial [Enterorhabdus sp. P55]|uniref:HIRAN domain-containing protein n=1 Tax=Enterorhabdus sp. P55 TaxID=2304571 RepID=UPI001369AEEF